MASREEQFPSSIGVECPSCRQPSTVTLTYSEGNTAEYEGLCEVELEAGSLCGAALMVTVTRSEEIEDLEEFEQE